MFPLAVEFLGLIVQLAHVSSSGLEKRHVGSIYRIEVNCKRCLFAVGRSQPQSTEKHLHGLVCDCYDPRLRGGIGEKKLFYLHS